MINQKSNKTKWGKAGRFTDCYKERASFALKYQQKYGVINWEQTWEVRCAASSSQLKSQSCKDEFIATKEITESGGHSQMCLTSKLV